MEYDGVGQSSPKKLYDENGEAFPGGDYEEEKK